MIGAITAGLFGTGATAIPLPPVSGYYLLFDASDASTITASGGYVSQWNDKSGNALNATNSGGAAGGCPQTGINTRNGLNVLTYTQNSTNGAAGGLTNNSGTFPADPNLDIWLVRKQSNGSVTSGSAFGIGNDQAGNDKVTYQFYDNSDSKYLSGANGGNIRSTASQSGNWNITRFTKSGAAAQFYVNNTSQGTASFNYNLANSRFQVGALPQAGATNNGVYLMNGDLAEVLVYKTALSAGDATSTYNYLKSKWGF